MGNRLLLQAALGEQPDQARGHLGFGRHGRKVIRNFRSSEDFFLTFIRCSRKFHSEMTHRSEVSRTPRYADLSEYIKASGKRKQFVAKIELEIDPPRLSELLNPEMYEPRVDDSLVERIAKLLNQSPNYVRKLYRAA